MNKKEVKMTESQLREVIKESIKKVINEIPIGSAEQEPLLEMARIDVPVKDSRLLGTKEIWVYGQDRSSMTPHFHYFDKKDNKKKFSIEVRISDLSVCFSHPRTGIPENKLCSWYGLSNEKKVLEQWLTLPNSDAPSITNYDAIKLAWNQNNRENPVT